MTKNVVGIIIIIIKMIRFCYMDIHKIKCCGNTYTIFCKILLYKKRTFHVKS